MGAVDPTYPLYPVACVLATVMLFLVLLTSFIRQNWNFGVALLCFWLSLLNLTNGVNAILWSDNNNVKLYVYCDIGTPSDPMTVCFYGWLIPCQCHICKNSASL